jgi:hypothetical protein
MDRANHPTAAEYITAIRAEWDKSHAATIAIGRLLLEAQACLDHGEWLKLFDPSREKAGRGESSHPLDSKAFVPFGSRQAQKYMRVAKHPLLSNTNYSAYLPRSINTLEVLSRVGKERLEKALSDGRLHCMMTTENARALLDGQRFERLQTAMDVLVELSRAYPVDTLVGKPTEILVSELFDGTDPSERHWLGNARSTAKWLLDVADVVERAQLSPTSAK